MKSINISLITALFIATTAFAEEKSDIGISANIAMTSNYVWRGMTQSDNSPAIQGGFDLDYKGIYAGVWGSNIKFDESDANMEFDAYVGYEDEIYGFGYDVGYVQYAYPNDSKALNLGEAYLGLSYDFHSFELNAKYSLGVQTDDTKADDCIEGGVSISLPMDISFDATLGNYIHTGVYYETAISKSFDKFELSLAYTGMNYDESSSDDEGNIIATISASF